MKSIYISILISFISLSLFGQAGINYKAVIKDNVGNLVINTPVQVQFGIHEDFDGLLIYSETHSTTTDDNGIVILTIGTGTLITGVFDDAIWSDNDTSLNVQVDKGNGLIDMGTTAFTSVPYAMHARTAEVAQNLTGLEFLFDDGNFGYRLINRNPDFYGPIGLRAIDFSYSPNISSINGATGVGSTAFGLNIRASGNYSFTTGVSTVAYGDNSSAMGLDTSSSGDNATATGMYTFAQGLASLSTGRSTFAYGDYSFATGRTTQANGSYSLASGLETEARGDGSISAGSNTVAFGNNSFAMGLETYAGGNNSVTFGYDTITIGDRSFAAGSNTRANGFMSFVLGRWNVGVGNSESWVGQDPLFEIGIGTSNNNRANAMTVLKNGNVGIGTVTPQEALQVVGTLLVGTETIEDTGSNQLSFGASLIPDANNSYRLGNSSSRWIGVWAVDGTINTSDRRDKENITDLDYGVKEIQKLKPVSFNWKERPEAGVKLGLIAQDLQEIIPEVVMADEIIYSEDDPTSFQKKSLDRLGVYYSDLIPVLIKAIQEQQGIISLQKDELASQGSEIRILSEEISQIQLLIKKINQFETNPKNF